MKKVTIVMIGLFFAAAVATTALAFGPGRGPGYGPCARGDFQGLRSLNLTEDQKTKIKEMRDAQSKDIKPLQEQMWTKRDALRKLWLEPKPDQAKIVAAQKEMNAVRDQIQEKMTAFQLGSLNVLTPEQKENVNAFAGRRGFGPRGGMHHGGWGGNGCFGGGPEGFGR